MLNDSIGASQTTRSWYQWKIGGKCAPPDINWSLTGIFSFEKEYRLLEGTEISLRRIFLAVH